jgi:hypothetical protein
MRSQIDSYNNHKIALNSIVTIHVKMVNIPAGQNLQTVVERLLDVLFNENTNLPLTPAQRQHILGTHPHD